MADWRCIPPAESDQWFVGKDVLEDKAPFGQPLFLNITSLDVTVSYGVTDRLSVAATLPFSRRSTAPT